MQAKKTIGIDASRSYRAVPTGTERYSRRVIEELLTMTPANVQYRLFFNDPPPHGAELPGADIRVLPARKFWTHIRLSREVRRNQVDALFVPAHVLPLIHPARSIVTVHDLGYMYEPDSYTASTRLQLRLTTRWNVGRASQIIAISEATRNDIVRHIGTPRERISLVRHGIDQNFSPVAQEEADRYRAAARLPDQFVLCLSTIQPRKNLERLITAFERLALSNDELHLLIAGRIGWLSEPITGRIHASPFRERIRLLGHVPDPQLQALYTCADTFALPSLYEGFGLPVLEAMACGVPVLMSDRGALPELAGADSVVVDPLDIDAIAAGIAHQLARRNDRNLVAERIRYARQFSWRETARQTQDVLLSTLEPGLGTA